MSKTKSIFRYVTAETRAKFSSSTCLLTISVGQQSHEGDRFSSTMDLVNESFASCVLLVDDTLQRHNMALNRVEDADYFYAIALREGDFWLARNKEAYSKLEIPLKIYRWNKWLSHPQFMHKKREIQQLLDSELSYREAFEVSINEFLDKYESRLDDDAQYERNRAFRLSFNFVLEECAALSLWPELGCHFEVYPNRHNSAIEQTRQRMILQHYPDLLHAVTIGFRGAGQIQPQAFQSFSENEESTVELELEAV